MSDMSDEPGCAECLCVSTLPLPCVYFMSCAGRAGWRIYIVYCLLLHFCLKNQFIYYCCGGVILAA
jgi:hypothetical protein